MILFVFEMIIRFCFSFWFRSFHPIENPIPKLYIYIEGFRKMQRSNQAHPSILTSSAHVRSYCHPAGELNWWISQAQYDCCSYILNYDIHLLAPSSRHDDIYTHDMFSCFAARFSLVHLFFCIVRLLFVWGWHLRSELSGVLLMLPYITTSRQNRWIESEWEHDICLAPRLVKHLKRCWF